MGFSAMMNWTVWPPSLSHDRKWPCITKSTHSRVVGLRLEENLVVYKFNRPTDAYSLIAWPRATNVKKCGTQKLITRSSAAAKSTARCAGVLYDISREKICWWLINHFYVIGPESYTEFGKITQNNDHYAVQGHSRHRCKKRFLRFYRAACNADAV